MHPFSRRYGLKVTAAISALAASGHLVSLAEAAPIPVGTPDAEATGQVGGEFIIGVAELGDTLDPHKTGAAQSSSILSLCADGLVAKDYDGNFVPRLASDWTISDDGLTWTFTIRSDVKFHDGTPVTAQDVKYSFDRILDPETASVTAAGGLGPVVSTAAPDDTTFEFTLSEPFTPLIESLTGALITPVPQALVESMGADFGRKPVLTGPWMVDEWREGDRIILKRNPDYAWAPAFLHQDPPGAFIETIVFQSILEEASQVAAFEAGEIHQAALPAVDAERITEGDDFWVINYPRKGEVFVAFNITKAPFDDLNVRRALMQAVNQQDVLDAAVEGRGEVAYSVLPPTMFGYFEGAPEYAPAFDPEQAKTLLAEAGWADDDGDGVLEKDGQSFEFTLLNFPQDERARAAQVIQAQFKDVGVTMNIEQLEYATLVEQVSAGNHDAAMMEYDYFDPDAVHFFFHSSQIGVGFNINRINDPALDELIISGRQQSDLEERKATYEEIQKIVIDQGLFIPLWIDHYSVGFNKKIHNLVYDLDNAPQYYDAWIAE